MQIYLKEFKFFAEFDTECTNYSCINLGGKMTQICLISLRSND